jgi:VIT1/CCC1 family predicted Fe2+/Mn2+ transporter
LEPKGDQMTLTFTHIAAVVAGLAIVATGFTVAPVVRNNLLKSMVLAIALAVTAAVLITAARQFG